MICENCNTEFSIGLNSKRFCSIKCARSFATKYSRLKHLTKKSKCVECGTEIDVSQYASIKNTVCNKCQNLYRYARRRCKVCGSIKKCIHPEICKKTRLIPALHKYFGFDISTLGTDKVFAEYERIQTMVYNDYLDCDSNLTFLIQKYYHHNIRNFWKILKSLGIPLRTISEANRQSILKGRKTPVNYKYKHGWHTTWNNKNIFYRSSYELDFAKDLDKNKIEYEVESKRIVYYDTKKCINRIAIPDFYLPQSNTIVEIKSKFTYDAQNMKDKLKAYQLHNYNFKLYIDKKLSILDSN